MRPILEELLEEASSRQQANRVDDEAPAAVCLQASGVEEKAPHAASPRQSDVLQQVSNLDLEIEKTRQAIMLTVSDMSRPMSWGPPDTSTQEAALQRLQAAREALLGSHRQAAEAYFAEQKAKVRAAAAEQKEKLLQDASQARRKQAAAQSEKREEQEKSSRYLRKHGANLNPEQNPELARLLKQRDLFARRPFDINERMLAWEFMLPPQSLLLERYRLASQG